MNKDAHRCKTVPLCTFSGSRGSVKGDLVGDDLHGTRLVVTVEVSAGRDDSDGIQRPRGVEFQTNNLCMPGRLVFTTWIDFLWLLRHLDFHKFSSLGHGLLRPNSSQCVSHQRWPFQLPAGAAKAARLDSQELADCACKSRKSSIPSIASAWPCVMSKASMLLTPYLGSVCKAACACQEGKPPKTWCDLSWPLAPINGNLNA